MKNFKRFLSVALALTMLFSFFTVAGATETAEKTVFSASADFSGTQGENGWYYSSLRDTTGAIEAYTFYGEDYNGVNAWLQGSSNNVQRGYVSATAMMPGTNQTPSFSAVRGFKAPKAGVIKITADDISALNKTVAEGKYFGVDAIIKKNNEVIWSYELDTREDKAEIKGLTLSVNADDMIYFIATRDIDLASNNITTQGPLDTNAITFDPTITYVDVTGYHIASEEFSTTTSGENNWSYYGTNYGGTGEDRVLAYNSSLSAWANPGGGSSLGQIGADFMLPGVVEGNAVSVTREYAITQKGSVHIDALGKIGAKDIGSTALFGVKIRIQKNGTTVYPATGDWETLSSRTAVSAFGGLSLDVIPGDKIQFEAARAIDNSDPTKLVNNVITWNPMVKYTSVVERKTVYSDTFDTEINKAFWNTELDAEGNSLYTIEEGAMKASQGWARFYAPYAGNYGMSFDLTFDELNTQADGDKGFYIRLRRPNEDGVGFYQIRFDITKTTNDIVWGYAGAAGFFDAAAGAGAVQRVTGTTENVWAADTKYAVKVSVETGSENDILSITVTNPDGVKIVDASRTLTKGFCPAGGGGFSVNGAAVTIDNFVLEGETSESAIDTNLKFYADDNCTTELTVDTDPNGLVVAGIEKTAGFDDYAETTPVVVLLAAYDSNGMLVSADINQCEISSRHKNIVARLSGENITAAYNYRAFIFNDLNDISPVSDDIMLEYSSISQKKN